MDSAQGASSTLSSYWQACPTEKANGKHTPTHTQADKLIHIHRHTNTQTHTRTDTQRHRDTETHKATNKHSCLDGLTTTRPWGDTNTPTRARARTHSCACMHTINMRYTRRGAHTRAQARPLAHNPQHTYKTHTQEHTRRGCGRGRCASMAQPLHCLLRPSTLHGHGARGVGGCTSITGQGPG